MNWRRVTTEADLRAAKAIRRAVFIEEQGIAEELEHDEYDALTSACTHVIVCDHMQQPIGTGRLRLIEGSEATGASLVGKLERVCALRHARRSGCGRIIVGALEELASEAGAAKVKLGAQLSVKSFYEQLEYEVVSDVFIEAGIEHVLMEKKL